ncbi:MAG: hypothetical protein OEZ36_04680 [Spirochaetota bacterium]|nr:hypothetical protein [Spirochaetota bacterium]
MGRVKENLGDICDGVENKEVVVFGVLPSQSNWKTKYNYCFFTLRDENT